MFSDRARIWTTRSILLRVQCENWSCGGERAVQRYDANSGEETRWQKGTARAPIVWFIGQKKCKNSEIKCKPLKRNLQWIVFRSHAFVVSCLVIIIGCAVSAFASIIIQYELLWHFSAVVLGSEGRRLSNSERSERQFLEMTASEISLNKARRLLSDN